ncbi:glycosyltransferase [Rhabdothermincola salaria]|uniref:glycosyltransferase n=1 Tax=Rhabdothermincola salaria TaxID=2903142 RepID=UPI001E5A651C|nr:glycosyltransferase [Rhabdothermincola salaria]MCD9623368.1 hypothetical protein [Rhabdothermincola salaria]
MAGPAIRAVELARALAAEGHPVEVLAPEVSGPLPAGTPPVSAVEDDEAVRARLQGADAVVGFSAVLAERPWIFELGIPVVVDAYDPGLLETLVRFQGSPVNEQRDWVSAARRHLLDPLERADLVLVASERQRHLVLGLLVAAGRVNPRTVAEDPTLRSLCAVVPFGTPSDPPEPTGGDPLRGSAGLVADDAVVALWGGGLYGWLDPLTLVRAVARCEDERVVAVFLAGPHPTPAVGASPLVERTRQLADDLGVLGRRVVLVERWVPYAERGDWLLSADIGVSLHHDHVETTFSFRTRILDYLWAGLPILCTQGDHFADIVEGEELGAVVPFGSAGAVAAALRSLAGETAETARRRSARIASRAARSTWSSAAAPLADWCTRPRLAADRSALPGDLRPGS